MAASAQQPPAGDDRNLVTIDENYLAPSFEDRLQIFWEKHSRTVVAIIVMAVVALVIRWAFDWYGARRENAVQAEYAAATTSAQLLAFTVSNPTVILAGVAHLRLADEAYEAGRFADAKAAYEAAVPLLGTNPMVARARLGAAISPLQAGDTAAGRTALEALANDTTFTKTLRAEAAYHLATIARDAGQAADALRWAGTVSTIDAKGMWGQRADRLRDALPIEAAPVAPPAPAAVPVAAEATDTSATPPAPAATPSEPSSVSFPGTK